jgi:hypothetical protein
VRGRERGRRRPDAHLGQIITGIGFIGAGVIAEALAISPFAIVVLVVLEHVESAVPALQRGAHSRDGARSEADAPAKT